MKKEFLVSGKQFFITEAMPLVSGDANCYELVFYAPCDLSDSVFTVTATRSDGESFTGMGTVFGKTAKYVLDNSMYKVPGQLKLRTTITAPDETVITANEITFDVIEGTNSDEAVEADTNYPVLTQLILQVQGLIDSVSDAKASIEKAEAAAENAETEAIFANSAAVEAKTYGAAAQVAAERAQGLVDKINGVTDVLPPAFSQDDAGKILYLTKNGTVSDLVSESRSYSFDDNVILDAGLLDEERAFIDISGAELSDIGISDPLDERCAFGFQLMPDSMNYTTDYDITAEEVEETDEGIRMIFPAEHCEPFAENNIQSASDLFAIFERVQFNSDFPKDCLTPAWGTPGEVLPASFLDESIISPSVRLAKEYTDESLLASMTFYASQGEEIIKLPEGYKSIKRIKLWFEKADGSVADANEGCAVSVHFYENASEITDYECELGGDDYVGLDAETGKADVYCLEDGTLTVSNFDDLSESLLNVMRNAQCDGMKIWQYSASDELYSDYVVKAELLIEVPLNEKVDGVLTESKAYTDEKIQQAVIDSWEVAV